MLKMLLAGAVERLAKDALMLGFYGMIIECLNCLSTRPSFYQIPCLESNFGLKNKSTTI